MNNVETAAKILDTMLGHLGIAATVEAQENVALQVADQMSDYLLTGAISNAVNFPSISAEEAPKLIPFVRLAEQLGLFAGQLTETGIEAVRLAWQAPGVREVINEIEVNDTSGLDDQARDAWIATQLKTNLLFDKNVSSINYSIETVNKVIYLMGVAQSQAELNRVIGHAKDIAYVRRVVSYVLLKDDPRRTS